jgi:hypothetical protein
LRYFGFLTDAAVLLDIVNMTSTAKLQTAHLFDAIICSAPSDDRNSNSPALSENTTGSPAMALQRARESHVPKQQPTIGFLRKLREFAMSNCS